MTEHQELLAKLDGLISALHGDGHAPQFFQVRDMFNDQADEEWRAISASDITQAIVQRGVEKTPPILHLYLHSTKDDGNGNVSSNEVWIDATTPEARALINWLKSKAFLLQEELRDVGANPLYTKAPYHADTKQSFLNVIERLTAANKKGLPPSAFDLCKHYDQKYHDPVDSLFAMDMLKELILEGKVEMVKAHQAQPKRYRVVQEQTTPTDARKAE